MLTSTANPRPGARLLCGALLLALLGACATPQKSTPPPPAQVEQPVVEEVDPGPPPPPRVAVLLPLSGPDAAVGRDLLDAVQLALFTVGENEVEILPRDTAGDPATAARVATEVLDLGAELVLGPLFARSAREVGAVAAARGVPVLSFSNDSSIAGPGLFVLGFRPEEQVARILDYARRRGLARIGALVPDDAYGRRALEAWRRAYGDLPEPPPWAVYSGDQNAIAETLRDFTAYDARVRALAEQKRALAAREDEAAAAALARLESQDTFGPPPFDAVLIADGGLRLRAVAALLAYYDVDAGTARFLGTMRWLEDPELTARDTLVGAWLAARSPAKDAAFGERFEAVYGRAPRPLASLAFDATALAVLLSRSEPRFDPAQLTDPQGFDGFSGIFRLRPDGLAEHGLAVLEVRRGELVEIDPAPSAFPTGFAADGPRPDLVRAAPPRPARRG